MTEHDAIDARPLIPQGAVVWSDEEARDRRLPPGAGDAAADIAGPPSFRPMGPGRRRVAPFTRDGLLLGALSLSMLALAGAAALQFDRAPNAWIAAGDDATPTARVAVVETRVIAVKRAPLSPVALATK